MKKILILVMLSGFTTASMAAGCADNQATDMIKENVKEFFIQEDGTLGSTLEDPDGTFKKFTISSILATLNDIQVVTQEQQGIYVAILKILLDGGEMTWVRAFTIDTENCKILNPLEQDKPNEFTVAE